MGVAVSLPVRVGIDPHRVRSRFPALTTGVPVRLDTFSHPPVLDRALDAASTGWDDPCEGAEEEARARLADLLDVPITHRVVLTRGAADAMRLVARAWAKPRLRPGDEILLTEAESHATLLAWQEVARWTSARLRFLPFRAQGRVHPDDVAAALTPRTRLLCLPHALPVLGTLLPVAELAEPAQERGIPVLVDGSAAAPSLPVDLALLDLDFYTVDGAPFGAPRGTGALVVRGSRLPELDPGELPGRAEVVDLTWARFAPPHRALDALAPAPPLALALAEAAAFRASLDPYRVRRHCSALARRLLGALARVPGLRVFGPAAVEERATHVAFAAFDRPATVLARDLAFRGIAVSAGHHDAMPVHRRLQVPETCLASIGPYTSADDVDALADALADLLR